MDPQFHEPLLDFLIRLQHKFILIGGQGGSPATKSLHTKLLSLENFVHWFAQNGEFRHPRFSHIPAGINCFEHGKAIMAAMSEQSQDQDKQIVGYERSKLLLIAFSKSTHESRERVYDHFCTSNTFPWVTCWNKKTVGPEKTFEAQLAFYRELRQFKYIICPRGVGHDAHRQYEGLRG